MSQNLNTQKIKNQNQDKSNLEISTKDQFTKIYGNQPWPIPTQEDWYWSNLISPNDTQSIWRNCLLNPFLNFLGLNSKLISFDPTFGRFSLPYSPHENLIRNDPSISTWDHRIFLEKDSNLIDRQVNHQTNHWIYYQVWWDQSASKKLDVNLDLVYYHGLGEYGGNFAKHAKIFLDAGYRLIVPDHPSHGRSTGLHTYLPNLDSIAHATHAVLIDLINKDKAFNRQQRQVVIAGQSLGGFASIFYPLLYHTPTIKKVNLLDGLPIPKLIGILPMCPMLAISQDSRPSFIIETIARCIVIFAGRVPLADANKGKNTQDPWCEEQYRRDPQTYHGTLRCATGLAILDALDFTDQNISKLEIPFQVMHGQSDRVTSVLGSQKLFDTAKSKNKSIKLYPKVEHVMLRIGRDEEDDKARQLILNDMLQWLEKLQNKHYN
ncbi:hypothetical protein O181_058918 [Austropuccinia psidii MF-1]|uniref:Serine aminopeptidase S33 domain-containing protein n=1 Tax=Austropuccinia psidii MF-1 TaxID=1389203 RepID=A0A9Q3HW18_9BASI|nr:hypothetical protein [Austropuccinia psidii MF-1]